MAFYSGLFKTITYDVCANMSCWMLRFRVGLIFSKIYIKPSGLLDLPSVGKFRFADLSLVLCAWRRHRCVHVLLRLPGVGVA